MSRHKKCYKYDKEDMLRAIKAVNEKIMSTRLAAKTFSVPRTSLQRKIEGKYDINSHSGRKPIMAHLDEKKLIDYSCNRASMGIGFGKTQFLKYAAILGKKKNIIFKQGIPSDKWWRLLKKRHDNFRQRKPEGTASIRHERMDKEFVSKYFEALKEQLDLFNFHDKPDSVWNMDETGVQLDHVPHKVIARKGAKHLHSRTSGKRETITIIAAVNANGKYIPPHIIVKGKTEAMLHGFDVECTPIGTNMSVSDSGWTKQGLAQLWFKNTFLPSIGSQRPQILILDGHDSHNFLELIEMAREENIILFELPSHTSHWLQPLDRTVFFPFKNYYNDACQSLMNEYPGVLVSHANFCGLFRKAWEKALTSSNIISGFRACGILPFNPNAIPNEAYMTNIPHNTVTNQPVIETLEINQEDIPLIGLNTNSIGLISNDKLESAQLQGIIDLNMDISVEQTPLEHFSGNKGSNKRSSVSQFEEVEMPKKDKNSDSCTAKLALHALEKAIKPETLKTYKRIYNEGKNKPNDGIYSTWKRYKDMTTTSTIINNNEEQENLEPKFQRKQITQNTGLIQNILNSNDRPIPHVNNMLESQVSSSVSKSSTINTQILKSIIPVSSFYSIPKNNLNNNSFHHADEDSDILPYPTTTKSNRKICRSGNYFVLTSNEVFEAKKRAVTERQRKAAQKEERAQLREQKKKDRAEIEKKKKLKRQACQKSKKQ